MNPIPKQHKILFETEIQYISTEFDALLLQGSISHSNFYLVKSLLNSHCSLLAANAELSFKNMELKKQNSFSNKSTPILVFTNFESGQRGYETFSDDQEASERFEYLSMYYSEGEDVGVEIGIAEVTRLERHNWSE